MGLKELLEKYRKQVIEEWIARLKREVSERYKERPYEELSITVSAAYDASTYVLLFNDYSKINCHIEWITRARLHGGFTLSEVQHAYELIREILTPIFLDNLQGEELKEALIKLNRCTFYTITQFSRNFQSLHESKIREHAQNLERMVEARTKELTESEAKYRTLVEDINDGYFVNQGGIIVFANKAYCDMHGYDISEVVGKSYYEFIAEESLEFVKSLYDERIKKGEAPELYVYLRKHKDGRCYPTENKVKIITYDGQMAVAGICRDITERVEMEKKIRETENLAQIGRLTTSLAHEIRNPLSSVKLNIQILKRNAFLDGNDRRRIEIVLNEITKLERILTEMLDFARPIKLNVEKADINRIVESSIEVIEVRAKEKKIRIKKLYSAKLPQLNLDKDKIEQALINILLNSIDVLDGGGVITVATRKANKNGGVIVDIYDNGPGIDKDSLPFIFDPFFSNKKKGTGLGLFNVKRIVEAHGGKVEVYPGKRKGAHFSIFLP
ncbi:MAG: PAS domain S-box protein [Desulfobacterota bacterium]|nr:PAS domain S-box protein [Thermodesulfobacteriota bacterium]MDW8001986.1 PAS domain S-box protein [Deltaproteobacteria bacterium]